MNKKLNRFTSSFLVLVVLLGFSASSLSMSASEVPNNPYGIPNNEYIQKNNYDREKAILFGPVPPFIQSGQTAGSLMWNRYVGGPAGKSAYCIIVPWDCGV